MATIGEDHIAALGTAPLSTEPYLSADYFGRERERIFRRTWLYAARVEEFARPGDFQVRAYEAAGASVLLVRGKDDRIRAFHNVCSHRHARLVGEPRGNARQFVCPYHGWGYALNGDLKLVPDAKSFYDLDLATCALAPVHVDVWRGFVFLCFADEPEQTLAEFLQPIGEKLADHGFEGCTAHVALSAEIDVNWKAMLDNFQETYHLGFIHDRSVGDRAVAPGNPFGHPISFEFFGPHRYMSIWGNPEHRPATVEAMAGRFGGVSGAGAAQQTDHYRRIRPANWQLDVHGIFPNLLIEVAPTFFYTMEISPLAVDRSRWTARMFLPPATTAGQRFSQEYNVAAFRDTVAEDVSVLKSLQAAMASRARSQIRFQKHEALCRHSYVAIDAAVRQPAAVAAGSTR